MNSNLLDTPIPPSKTETDHDSDTTYSYSQGGTSTSNNNCWKNLGIFMNLQSTGIQS